jgi:hypothetical protein
MLNEYTKNSNYRRFAELLIILPNLQEKILRIHLDKIFFRHFINRMSMKHLLHSIVRHHSSLIR